MTDFFNIDFLRSVITTFLGAGLAVVIGVGSLLWKERRDKLQATKASRKRQRKLGTAVYNELLQNRELLKVMRTSLGGTPAIIFPGAVYSDVWNSVQAEMVSLGLAFDDICFPYIPAAYMLYPIVHERALVIENISLDIHLGRLGEATEFLKQRTDSLKQAIDEAEAASNEAIEVLEEYEKHLLEGNRSRSLIKMLSGSLGWGRS